jgi:glyoxylase-like metal-dependent hydrolase (beta-lactamase superfamily II)
MWRDEWEYWTDEANLERIASGVFGDVIASFARKHLPPIASRLNLVDREAEIVPGIRVIPAPGHTPGHLAVAIASGSDELLYTADAAAHPIHLEQPDWYGATDLDPQRTLASKRRLFDHAAAEQSLVLAFHFHPFPSLGHVVRRGKGWQWQPIETSGQAAAEPEPAPVSRPV